MMNNTPGLVGALLITLAACGSAGAAVADSAVVACTQAGLEITSTSVGTQPDGVHIIVDNRSGAESLVYLDAGDHQSSHHAPAGRSALTIAHGPGKWRLACAHPSVYPGEDAEWVTLEVVDPDDLWMSDELPCDHPTSTHPDYEEYFEGGLPLGIKGDPLTVAQNDLANWHPIAAGDVVNPVGYPEASPRLFAVERDGETVAVADYRDDGRGGWFFGSISWCEDDGGS